jgi:heme exporter protein A
MAENFFQLNDLACGRGARLLFAGVNLELHPGDAALTTGPNGSGKSSLLRVIAGLIPPFGGRIIWNGEDVRRTPDNFRTALRYVGHSDGLQPTLSVIENLRYWATLYGSPIDIVTLTKGLDSVGLADLTNLPVRVLSAGQRRRLALARAISTGGKIWLLDEPTVALDAQSIRNVETAISTFRGEGGIVVASTNAPINLPSAESIDLIAYQWEEQH